MKEFIRKSMLASMVVMQIFIFFIIWQKYEIGTYTKNLDKIWAVMCSYAIISIIMILLLKINKIGEKALYDVIFDEFIAIFTTSILIYLQLCMLQNYPYLYSIKVVGFTIIINFTTTVIISIITHILFKAMTPIIDCVIILNKNSDLSKIIQKKKRNDKNFRIVHEIVISNKSKISDILKEIKPYNAVIVDDIYPLLRNQVLKECYQNNKLCYSITKVSDILTKNTDEIDIGYRLAFVHKPKEISKVEEIIKRIIDIFISSISIIILSPIILTLYILVRCTSTGGGIYSQERYTKNKRLFKIYKFRSMYDGSDETSMMKENDARVTPIGKFIRRTHLDELPQLFNVLKGDMSIVGPRPESKELYDMYEKQYSEYQYRLKVKAGLTGYAQVYGNYSLKPQDKLKFDMEYICNYSLFLDFKLIILTIKILFAKDASAGR